jgi:hypothetical protein
MKLVLFDLNRKYGYFYGLDAFRRTRKSKKQIRSLHFIGLKEN